MEKYRFNVFGRIIAIERAQAQWRCFNVGADGKRALDEDETALCRALGLRLAKLAQQLENTRG